MLNAGGVIMCGTLLMFACLFAFILLGFPPNTFSPTCTYTSQYELTGVLEVGNDRLTSTIATQRSLSRKWIETINYAGCQQKYGTVLTFKSSDGHVWLVESNICEIAEEVLRDVKTVDMLKICKQNRVAYEIDNAERPTTWRRTELIPGGSVQLVTLNAVSTRTWPYDNIDELAPNTLRARYDAMNDWWASPERLLRRRTEYVFRVRKAEVDRSILRGSMTP